MKRFLPGSGGQKPPPPPYQGPSSSDDEPTNEKRRDGSPERRSPEGGSPEPPDYTSKPYANQDPFRDNASAGPSSQGTGGFACLALSRSDSIRAIGLPESIWEVITRVIEESWTHRSSESITAQGLNDYGAYQWKLSGNPWSGFFSNAIPSKRLMTSLLSALSSNGWKVVASTAVTKHDWAKDSLFLRAAPPVDRSFFAVAFYRGDRVRLLDTPNAEVSQAVNQAISTWPLGIKEAKEIEPQCFQYRLRGNPFWTRDKKEQHHSRLMMCQMLHLLEQIGYELVASIDMSHGSGGGESQSDVDALFFASVVPQGEAGGT